jgi:hypothetical protein
VEWVKTRRVVASVALACMEAKFDVSLRARYWFFTRNLWAPQLRKRAFKLDIPLLLDFGLTLRPPLFCTESSLLVPFAIGVSEAYLIQRGLAGLFAAC